MHPDPATVRVPPCSSQVATPPWRRRLAGLLVAALCLGAATGAHAQTPGNADPGFAVGGYPDLSILGLQTNGRILLGGPSHGAAGVNPDGTSDASYSATAGSYGLYHSPAAQPDGKVLVLDSSEDTLRRLNADGTLDVLFQPVTFVSPVRQATVQPDGRIIVVDIVVYFTSGPQPQTAAIIDIHRFQTDGTLDNGFTNGLTQPIGTGPTRATCLAVQPNGQILVSTIDGLNRLNADGSVDTSFISSNLDVVALAVQPDGKILLGLDDTSNSYASGIARLNADGSRDTGFNANTGSGSEVNALALEGNGKILIGGSFTQINGAVENNLARLNADGSVDTTFVSPGYGDAVNSLFLQPDGKVLVEGSAGLARYYAYTPVTTSATTATGMVGQPFSYQITADNDPASFTATPLPDGLTLNAATGVISGTPTSAGTFQLTLGTLDATGASTGIGTLTLAIAAVPITPVITSDMTAVGTDEQSFYYQIRASNTPTSFAASPLPDGLTLSAATGVISGTPTTTGTFAVNLAATNGGGTGTATLSLTLSEAPIPLPQITSAYQATAQQGQAFSYQITATNSPTSFGADGLPSGLTVNTATGLISGVPTYAGTSSVTLTATLASAGGYSSGYGTLTLTVTPAPAVAPVITSASSVTAQQGQAFSYQIAAANSPTSFGASGLPAGLSVNSATGLISGTPTVAGTFSVTLAAINRGGAGTATVSLMVAPAVPVATLVATMPSVIAGNGQIGEFTLSLSPAPTSDVAVSFTIMGTAVNGTDYLLLKATKKIKAGSAGKPIKITPLGDGDGAGVKRTVVLTLQPGSGYTVGTTGKVKVKIYGE